MQVKTPDPVEQGIQAFLLRQYLFCAKLILAAPTALLESSLPQFLSASAAPP